MLCELWGCCFWLKMDFLNLPAPGHALGLCEHPCVWAWHFPPPLLGHLSASWFLSAQFFLLCQPESILPTSQKAATKCCEMRGWC